MKLKFRREDEELEETYIDLTSLIDVVFLLLLFFMVTTRFMPEYGIDINLPEANSQSEIVAEPKNEIHVALNAKSELTLDGSPIKLEEIASKLLFLQQTKKASSLIIEADRTVPHGNVVTVMDAARQAGLTNIGISATPNPAQEMPL